MIYANNYLVCTTDRSFTSRINTNVSNNIIVYYLKIK